MRLPIQIQLMKSEMLHAGTLEPKLRSVKKLDQELECPPPKSSVDINGNPTKRWIKNRKRLPDQK